MIREYMLSGAACWGLFIVILIICGLQAGIAYLIVDPLSVVYKGAVDPLELVEKDGQIQLKYSCGGRGYYTDNADAILGFVKDPRVKFWGTVYKSGRLSLKKEKTAN